MKSIAIAIALLITPSLTKADWDLCLPWEGTRQSNISNFEDAWEHWNSGAGGYVPAGSGLYSEIRYSDDFEDYIDDDFVPKVVSRISKTRTSGSVSGSGTRGWEVYPLGSYEAKIEYRGTWSASSWRNNKRTVTAKVGLTILFEDRWDFMWNDSYSPWENIRREFLPEIIAGCGTEFSIYGSFTRIYTITFTQRR